MADATLDALYQEVILDHNRRPRNFHPMAQASCSADGKNPNCGDQLTIWLKVEDETVTDVSFQGQGCAISKASASMMTEAVKGKTRADAVRIYEKVHKLLTGEDPAAAKDKELGSLRALGGVSKFPMRVKCASLSWHAMKAALDGTAVVSTEGPEDARSAS
ncbi:MAG: SUF system NifU family Fe-S cluster assembly protein [Gemmatimonadaceae bacterium]|nr:SUF system NifU family Fe-S cluster assembly protein [Gemmatimonadaceae bacterium]MCW5826392.1 SUF system NifU family Fe-S cluster assembly protein [Gemmatimonadaceae bacterium]